MNVPSAAVALAARKKARNRCALCRKKIRTDDPWVTRITDLAPVHELCALADPRVRRVEIEHP